MKKAIVTGLNGTVAPYVKKALENEGITVFKWDRNAVSTKDQEEMIQFLEVLEPDYIIHLAMGTIEWTAFLADYCFRNHIKFVYTSTESVFEGNGPFTLESIPNAISDYGRYKIESEKIIKQKNPQAYIIRLGWQIGDQFEKNNMLNFLQTTFDKQGYIEASDNWIPSTCYIKESAKWMVRIVKEMDPGLYQIEGNDESSFYDIVKLIEKKYRKDWRIRKIESTKRDNRLIDHRIETKKVKDILA